MFGDSAELHKILLAIQQVSNKVDALTTNFTQGQTKLMAAIDDLNSAVTNLGTSVTTGLATVVQDLKNAQGSGNQDAAIEAAVTNINTISGQLTSGIAALPTGASGSGQSAPAPQAAPSTSKPVGS